MDFGTKSEILVKSLKLESACYGRYCVFVSQDLIGALCIVQGKTFFKGKILFE